ncbi:SRPBCC domain-containing protein [Agrococcus sp. SCSIO52902]|uniref:pyroglutamyl-peptidase I family protein n=1 Tax=Agrococcus sp. SCSIO52902 TaxID=2933290 RepID=UPI001FF506F9|nr:SRPBCC domain-containing protein [Agrococcus sp. SCSIO52902]UOW01527.1 SRPBCC domain-containing protein [Agrococcus sp. SCSIO52902]
MRILVTAFEPFGGDPENASLEAVRRLADAWAADPQPGAELVTGTLPVAFGAAGPALRALVDEHRPDAVLAVGEAGGRSAITPERWAVNEDDARIPDNAGDQPRGTPIDPAGPAGRPSGFDVDALVSAILAVGLPADASDDAGRFLCNHVAYLVAGLDVPGGFVHVPAVRTSGTAGVGDETDPGASADASAITHEGRRLTFDDLALGLAAAVRSIAHGDSAAHEHAREAPRVDRAGTVIAAAPDRVYAALLDAEALTAWLPPEGATAVIEGLDAREGGGFRAVLRFDDPVDPKTDEATDASRVTFVELVPHELVVQRVAFESAEERFRGDMLMTWRMQPVAAGTRVTVSAADVPPGISPEDHELGLGQSLAKLAAYLEGQRGG